MTILRP